MRWLVLVLVLSLVACEPRVIVTRTSFVPVGGAIIRQTSARDSLLLFRNATSVSG